MKYMKGFFFVILLVAIDQLTKFWASTTLKGNSGVSVIDGVFRFEYIENTGAAFSLLEGNILIFLIFTLFLLVFLCWAYTRIPEGAYFRPLKIVAILLASGALGNFIDRLIHNFVVDFLYFELINFPVFNIADCYITIAVIIFAILIFFRYQDDDFEWKEFKNQSE